MGFLLTKTEAGGGTVCCGSKELLCDDSIADIN